VTLNFADAPMVIKANRPENKTNCAVGIGRSMTQKGVRLRKIETLLRKQKHGVTFAGQENNLVSNKMLIDVRTMTSDMFF
jgi:hypothetical protein